MVRGGGGGEGGQEDFYNTYNQETQGWDLIRSYQLSDVIISGITDIIIYVQP